MKLAIGLAEEALRQYQERGSAVATAFFEQDLSIFLEEVEKAKAPDRLVRLIRFYLNHYNSREAEHKPAVADYFFRSVFDDIIQRLEDYESGKNRS